MEELGCHFKFESIPGEVFHDTNLLLSSGRNCLRYIIRERNIKKIYLPYFLCESLSDVSAKEDIEICFYHIDNNYMPIDIDPNQLNDNTYLYYVNYYGLKRDALNRIKDIYKYVIVDNTHDFYDTNKYDFDVIYNYRKYFGVPDGACIVSKDLAYNPDYSRGKSLEKIKEMVLRDETGEYLHYPTFIDADKHFQNEDLRYMSNFTENYLHAIDFDSVAKQRNSNYQILSAGLDSYNAIDIGNNNLTYMYPLLVYNGEDLRKYLKENNIYSVKLWANVNWNGANAREIQMADDMILLPIDQRYTSEDMQYIVSCIKNYYNNKSLEDEILVKRRGVYGNKRKSN